jgi:hypothetical protein
MTIHTAVHIWTPQLNIATTPNISRILYNQRDATLYNVLYYYLRSTCFGRYFRPSSGAYKTVCEALGIVMLSCCLPLVWMGWNSSAYVVGTVPAHQHQR